MLKYLKKKDDNDDKEKEANKGIVQPSITSISITTMLNSLFEDADYQQACDLLLSVTTNNHVIIPWSMYNSLIQILSNPHTNEKNSILIYQTLSKLLQIYSPSLYPLAWSPKTNADFEMIHNALKRVAITGSSATGNYLLLLYFLEILDDDRKHTEEKKLQFKLSLDNNNTTNNNNNDNDNNNNNNNNNGIKGKDTADSEDTSMADVDMEPQLLLDRLSVAQGVDRSAKRMLVEAAMTSIVEKEEEKEDLILGKKRRASSLASASISASFASSSSSSSSFSSFPSSFSSSSSVASPPSEKTKTEINDYLALSACMRMLEHVLYSNSGMDEQRFTIWSTFKTLDGNAKVLFLNMFTNHPLKLELLNFFLDNCNTPRDRAGEYKTKAVSHAKIIQFFFNTRPISFTRKSDVPAAETFVYLIYHLVITWICLNDQYITAGQYKELYEHSKLFDSNLHISTPRSHNAKRVIDQMHAICRVKASSCI